MLDTRMIICGCGGADELKNRLSECGAQVAHSFRLIPGVAAGMSPDALKQFFARYPDARVIPDRRRQIPPMPFGPDDWKEVAGPGEVTPTTSPDAPEISPLALTLIKADEVQNLGIDGSGVRVCIIDSGIDCNHPDLLGTMLLGPDGQPLMADFTETDTSDTVGHGTAVAGCVASQGKQVYTITDEVTGRPSAYTKIRGIAPGARLMAAKVFDTRVASGYDSTIIAALEWAGEQGAHIINMSLGGGALPNDGTDPLAAAVTALREKGILVIISAGNEGGGIGSVASPGSSPGALTVGASTMYRSFSELGFLAEPGKWTSDQLASFSSQGPAADGRLKPEILAPGAFDWGLAPMVESEEGQTYQLFGGTSQAAPLMTGAACLIFQAFQKARGRFPTPDEAVRIICSTADDLGFPAHMMGAGRVNALRAVQAILGQEQTVSVTQPAPVVVQPGGEAQVSLELTNLGTQSADRAIAAVRYEPAKALSQSFNGQIATAQPQQQLHFEVKQGTDLMQISLDWPTNDHGPQAPRLMVALYDPDGRFVNYQRPNTAGDIELGKSVDTWIARPTPGQWTARVVLRQGQRDTVMAYTLAIRAFRRQAWDWVQAEAGSESLNAGETKQINFTVKVPADTASSVYAGHIMVGDTAVPLSVVVPVALEQGSGNFAGQFQHGYQGSWGNGDWLYHDVPVPEGTRSLVASIQWPDVDNALEMYLVDPSGVVTMGRSNSDDIVDDGDSSALGGQIVLANPEAGNWRLVLHSFAFCGRGMPEPYYGVVETAGELVSPRIVQLRVAPGEAAPLALYVKNPGRMPLTVQAVAQSVEPRLVWHNVATEIKSGVTQDGQAEGQGHVSLGAIDVPFGAKQLGVILTWDQPDAQVSLSLFDPVAQSDRATAASTSGQIMVLENNPVPGQWAAMAGVTSPTVDNQTVTLKGATFVVAPEPLEGVETQPVTVQPGESALVPLTITLPKDAADVSGRIVVTTSRGDRLGEIAFRIESEDAGGNAEAAATK